MTQHIKSGTAALVAGLLAVGAMGCGSYIHRQTADCGERGVQSVHNDGSGGKLIVCRDGRVFEYYDHS